MPANTLRGVYAAAVTPLTADLEPDLKAFVGHCRWLMDNGCDGLAPLGTTGEANSFSGDQKLRILEALALSGLPVAKMIVGTGACALADTVSLTRRARAMGFGGVLVIPPFFYKNPSEDGLYAWYSEVIERIGDPDLPLFLYHFPQMSAVPITIPLIARLKAKYGAVIAGLKDSSGDWNNTAAILKEFPGFGVFSGTEQYLVDNLRAGGAGCISATVNVTAPHAGKVYANWQGDVATLQAETTEARLAIQKFPLVGALKEMKAVATGDAAWRRCMPPLTSLSREQADALIAAVRPLVALQRALAG
ncbi:MAG: dihydrodipicolinate synthase family protein [Rhodospirillales bacterium]